MNTDQIPWEQIYKMTLSCGNAHKLEDFSLKILSELSVLCPYDQALVYFLNGNGNMYYQHLINMDVHWNEQYLVHYSTVAENQYNYKREFRESIKFSPIQLREWEKEPASEFLNDYIRPMKLKYSLGIPLFDNYGRLRTLFALDRICRLRYSEQELLFLKLVVPQLNNLHKNFFCYQKQENMTSNVNWESLNLTQREIEVAKLLCEGASADNIGKTLYISTSTANKHIAHIYKKMKVSSKQELLFALLGK